MRFLAVVASAVAGVTMTFGIADAAPRLSVADSAVPPLIRVSGGCTIGFHPGPFGYCVQNGFVPAYEAPPTVVPIDAARRACPPGYHPGFFGLACVAD